MSHRRWIVVSAFVAALGLVAASCNGDVRGRSFLGAAAACRLDEFGCVRVDPGEPITVGTLLAITGAVSTLGLDSQRGVVLAADYLDGAFNGRPGRLLGHDIELIHQDDGCGAEHAAAVGASLLAMNPDVVAVIGTSCSSTARGVADVILGRKGILLISPSNHDPGNTAEGAHQPFYLRTAPNDKIQGAVVANFAYDELGLTTAATINDESPYAHALAAMFRDVFAARGGTITSVERIRSDRTDFARVLAEIATTRPEFLYYPVYNPACGLIVAQAAEVATLAKTIFVGSDGCFDPEYLEIAGPAADGTYISGTDVSGFQEGAFYQDEFFPAYERQFGAPTASFHAQAFDAANILFAAIEDAALEDGGALFIARTALRDRIFETVGYDGITGTITCTPLGDCAAPAAVGIFRVPDIPLLAEVTGGPVFTQTLSVTEAESQAEK